MMFKQIQPMTILVKGLLIFVIVTPAQRQATAEAAESAFARLTSGVASSSAAVNRGFAPPAASSQPPPPCQSPPAPSYSDVLRAPQRRPSRLEESSDPLMMIRDIGTRGTNADSEDSAVNASASYGLFGTGRW